MKEREQKDRSVDPAPGALSPDNLLSTRDAADRLGVTPKCLQKWRGEGSGPAYIKISHTCCRYRVGDLDEWVAERRIAA